MQPLEGNAYWDHRNLAPKGREEPGFRNPEKEGTCIFGGGGEKREIKNEK